MSKDHDFDALLNTKRQATLADGDTFAEAVMGRIDGYRRRRRLVLGLAGVLSALLAGMALMALPVAAVRAASMDLRSTLAVLALATLCGWVWIVTETGSVAARE